MKYQRGVWLDNYLGYQNMSQRTIFLRDTLWEARMVWGNRVLVVAIDGGKEIPWYLGIVAIQIWMVSRNAPISSTSYRWTFGNRSSEGACDGISTPGYYRWWNANTAAHRCRHNQRSGSGWRIG